MRHHGETAPTAAGAIAPAAGTPPAPSDWATLHRLLPYLWQYKWRVIAAIRSTGISTLIVDRDYKKVLAHTDKAVVMEKGRLALQAQSADLLQQPEKLSALLGV